VSSSRSSSFAARIVSVDSSPIFSKTAFSPFSWVNSEAVYDPSGSSAFRDSMVANSSSRTSSGDLRILVVFGV